LWFSVGFVATGIIKEGNIFFVKTTPLYRIFFLKIEKAAVLRC